jgi:hypothetical protein
MSVLPSSASLQSFFVAFIALVLITGFIGIITSLPDASQLSAPLRAQLITRPRAYFKEFLPKHLDPSIDIREFDQVWGNQELALFYPRRIPIFLIHNLQLPSISLPRRLWRLWELRKNPFWHLTWNLCFLLADAMRLLFWPVAIACLTCLLLYILLLALTLWLVLTPWYITRQLWVDTKQ